MSDPQPVEELPDDHECDNEPKLTAEEWAYIEATSEGGD